MFILSKKHLLYFCMKVIASQNSLKRLQLYRFENRSRWKIDRYLCGAMQII